MFVNLLSVFSYFRFCSVQFSLVLFCFMYMYVIVCLLRQENEF